MIKSAKIREDTEKFKHCSILPVNHKERDKWIEDRHALASKGYIGGSDTASLLSIYSSPYELMRKMRGQTPHFSGNAKTEVGNYLESLVADKVSTMIGVDIVDSNCTYQSNEHPFMFANLDYEVDNGGGLDPADKEGFECKTTSSFNVIRQLGENGSSDCPISYQTQCQHYMAVTGMTGFYIAVLVILDQNVMQSIVDNLKAGVPPVGVLSKLSHYYRWYYIRRDDAFIDKLIETEGAFHEAFINGSEPIDGSDITSDLLKDQYTNRTSDLVDPDAEDMVLLKEYWDLYNSAKEKEERIKQIKNIWRSKIRDSSGMKGVVQFSTTNKTKFDSKRFALEHPDLYQEYNEDSSYERMVIKKNKETETE